MGIVIAGLANMMMKRGPFVLSQTQSETKLYFKGQQLQSPNFIGLRPAPIFTMVNNAEDATRYNWWLSAWRYRRALNRGSEQSSAIRIESARSLDP